MTKSNLIDVTVTLHHETDKAWLVSDTGDKDDAVWVPKSQAQLEFIEHMKVWELTLPEWLAVEKGFV